MGFLMIDYGDLVFLFYDNVGFQFFVVGWLLWCVVGLFLGIRVYCKFIGSWWLWWDDYFLIVLQVIYLVVICLMMMLVVDMGYGKYFWDKFGVSLIFFIKEFFFMML